MNTGPRFITRVLPALAGFSAMAALGWSMAGKEPARTSTEESAAVKDHAATKATKRERKTTPIKGPPAAVARKLAAIRSCEDPALRMQAALDLANSLSTAEIAAWFEGSWANSLPDFERELFQKVAMQRWRESDPYGQLQWALRNQPEEVGATINLCVKADAKLLLATLRASKAPDHMEIRALSMLAGSDPASALALMKEIFAEPGRRVGAAFPFQFQSLFRELAIKSPALLGAALDGLPPELRKQAQQTLVWQDLTTDFTAAIRKLQGQPDGLAQLSNGLSAGGILSLRPDEVLPLLEAMTPEWRKTLSDQLGNYVTQNAEAWLGVDLAAAGFDQEQIFKIRRQAIERISSSDPENALRILDAITPPDPRLRKGLLDNIFIEKRDAALNEKLLAMLPDEERQATRKMMEDRQKRQSVAQLDPEAWLDSIVTDTKGLPGWNRPSLEGWDAAKLGELASRFRDLPVEKKQTVAMQLVARGEPDTQVPELQLEAIRYLIENPVSGKDAQRDAFFNLDRSTSTLAVRWVLQEPEAATRWVQGLPEGSTKLWAQKNMAANWMKHDPVEASRWVDTLPAETRGVVREFVGTK